MVFACGKIAPIPYMSTNSKDTLTKAEKAARIVSRATMVYMTPADFERVREQAERRGLRVGTHLRVLALQELKEEADGKAD